MHEYCYLGVWIKPKTMMNSKMSNDGKMNARNHRKFSNDITAFKETTHSKRLYAQFMPFFPRSSFPLTTIVTTITFVCTQNRWNDAVRPKTKTNLSFIHNTITKWQKQQQTTHIKNNLVNLMIMTFCWK